MVIVILRFLFIFEFVELCLFLNFFCLISKCYFSTFDFLNFENFNLCCFVFSGRAGLVDLGSSHFFISR